MSKENNREILLEIVGLIDDSFIGSTDEEIDEFLNFIDVSPESASKKMSDLFIESLNKVKISRLNSVREERLSKNHNMVIAKARDAVKHLKKNELLAKIVDLLGEVDTPSKVGFAYRDAELDDMNEEALQNFCTSLILMNEDIKDEI